MTMRGMMGRGAECKRGCYSAGRDGGGREDGAFAEDEGFVGDGRREELL